MANEQYAFIRKEKVPSLTDWQKAVDESGFNLKIDPSLEVFNHDGFLPCIVDGKDSGIETYYSAVSDLLDDPEAAAELAGDRDFCISFRWGSSFREGACAMILSYSLARSFGAIVSYEFEDPTTDLAALRQETEQMLNEAKKQK